VQEGETARINVAKNPSLQFSNTDVGIDLFRTTPRCPAAKCADCFQNATESLPLLSSYKTLWERRLPRYSVMCTCSKTQTDLNVTNKMITKNSASVCWSGSETMQPVAMNCCSEVRGEGAAKNISKHPRRGLCMCAPERD
jgi:hypothetical protein